MQINDNKLAFVAIVLIVTIVGSIAYFTGWRPGQQPLAITGDTEQPTRESPTGEGTVLQTEEACGDGKPDILSHVSYQDHSFSPLRETQVGIAYRIFLGDSKTAAYSGVSSATADTSTADSTFCGDMAHTIFGDSTPNGGYYFVDTGDKKLGDSKNKFYGLTKPTGDVQSITFNTQNATGAALATLDMTSATSVGQIKAILHLNSTSGSYGDHGVYDDDGNLIETRQAAILVVSEFEKNNFTDVKPAAKSGWTITLDTVPSNYSDITSGHNQQAWKISGIRLNPFNTEVEIPLIIDPQDNTNPGNAATGGQWTPISLTFYDLSTDIVNGQLVYAWSNQTSKTNDIGAPNRASAISNTTGIHIQ